MGKRTQKGFRALSLPNLEFQSTVDWHMAVRILGYVALLYQDMIRTKRVAPGEKLPPVVPVVLYNGEPRWTATREVADLIMAAPGGLERYRPHLCYLLVEEVHYGQAELEPLRNLVAALFRLEGSRSVDDVRLVLEALIDWLKEPEQEGLRRAFVVWFKRVFLPARMPGAELPELQDLQEVRTMLAERVIEWTKQWEEEGLKKGRQEGIQEGESLVLRRQLTRRFGPLPPWVEERLAQADRESLERWAERVLEAATLEEIFNERFYVLRFTFYVLGFKGFGFS